MSTEGRLHHLDFLRGSMMGLGVLVHASHADYDLGAFEWVRFLSGAFRMECFFVLSGYFSLMSLERYGPRRFLARRMTALGLPALFGVLLLNPPVIAWMRAYFATAPAPATIRINWHGPFWFLFVLMLYVLATRGIARALDAAQARVGRAHAAGVAVGLVVAASLAVAVVGVKLVGRAGAILPGFGAWGWIAHATFLYLPFFTFGLLMFGSPRLFALVHARPWAWGALAAAAVALKHAVHQREITNLAEHLLTLGVDFAAGFACSIALVSAAGRLIPRASRVVAFLAESAYTLYVVHYLVVALVLVEAQRMGLPLPARAIAAAALAFAVGLSLHATLVRRVPLAALLLNGRVLTPRPEAAVPAP